MLPQWANELWSLEAVCAVQFTLSGCNDVKTHASLQICWTTVCSWTYNKINNFRRQGRKNKAVQIRIRASASQSTAQNTPKDRHKFIICKKVTGVQTLERSTTISKTHKPVNAITCFCVTWIANWCHQSTCWQQLCQFRKIIWVFVPHQLETYGLQTDN